jgi:hypothetical protein
MSLRSADKDSPRRRRRNENDVDDDDENVTLPFSTSSSTSTTPPSSNSSLDSILTEDALLLYIAAFLPARDLLQYQSISKQFANLNTDSIWKEQCQQRWQPWPRYRLNEQRLATLEATTTMSWQRQYLAVEQEATRTLLQTSDLHNSQWYLSFVLSGIRGEGRSDHMAVVFRSNPNLLVVPGHDPLPYEIRNETPPTSPSHIRATLRGDRPFSHRQWLRISNFPVHFVTRKAGDAEWLIVNENVMMVSYPIQE